MIKLPTIQPLKKKKHREWTRMFFYPGLVAASMIAYFTALAFVDSKNIAQIPVAIGFSCVFIVHIFERLLPYRTKWNRSHGDVASDLVLTNVVLPALSKVTEIVLGWFFITSLGNALRGPFVDLWPHAWPVAAQLVAILLVCEFTFYWIHRLAHTTERLWSFHSIHHSVPRVYWNNAGRFHPVDLTLTWFIYFLPVFLFGVSPEVFAGFLALNAVTGLLEHANIDFECGPLNRIFNTAQLHRWHHSSIVKESSTNYGKVLSVWDQIFGTYFLPANRQVDVVGVTTEKIPRSAWGQMMHPIVRSTRLRKSSTPRKRTKAK